MALDRLGNTVATGQDYVVAGTCRRIDGNEVLLVLGDGAGEAVRVKAGDVIKVDDASAGATGEANTGSNVGASGVGVFDGKVGVDLQFRKIDAASSKVTTALNGQKIDVDVVPANFTGIPVAGITGLGTLATQSGTFSGTSSGTNTGDQTITLTGPVTGSGTGSFATTITALAVGTAQIAANAVTYAKLQQVATFSLVGNPTNTEVANAVDVPMADTTLEFSANALRRAAIIGDIAIAAGSNTSAIGAAKVTSAMLRNSAALSVIGRTANSSGVPADVAATAASDAVLRESGSVIGFGTIATAGIAAAAVTYAKIQNVAALSVMARSANSSGVAADVAASAASGAVLRESGSTIGFGTIATAGLAANAVTNAKLAQMATNTIKANSTSATADPADNSCDTVRAMLGAHHRNFIVNGEFSIAQRQVLTTNTVYTPAATARVYAHDRWALSAENSSVETSGQDTVAAPETGMRTRFWGYVRKQTSTGKTCLSQVVEAIDTATLHGRTVRLRCKMRTGSTVVVRLGLLQLSSSGTADTIPATFISAWGANTVDPTFGTNLALLAPATGEGGTVSGNAMTCTLTGGWVRYSATFAISATCLNVIPVFFSHSQCAANDRFDISEVELVDAPNDVLDYTPTPYVQDLLACQRFYCKTFPILTAPAQNGGVTGALRANAAKAAATAQLMHWRFPVTMRGTPALTLYNPSAANAQVRNITAAADCSASAAASATDCGVDVNATGSIGTASGDELKLHLAADAEL